MAEDVSTSRAAKTNRRRRATDNEPTEPRVGRRWTDRHPELAVERVARTAPKSETDVEWQQRAAMLRDRQRSRGFRRRGREFLYRFREPIIGVGVAAAAAPLIRAGSPTENAPAGSTTPASSSAASATSVFAGDLEDEVGERWAASEAERVRTENVTGAVERYGIDTTLAQSIYDAAEANDIDPDVAFGLVKTESTFNYRAVSHVGARGLTQVMPATARWLKPGTTAGDLFDRETNLNLGFGYLRDLIDKYDGNLRLALTAYNRGPGTVDRILRRGGNPDNGYAGKVLRG